jgi:lantibiotic modifying enzyme
VIPRALLIEIAERASDLHERLAPPFLPAPANDAIDARLARWAEVGAKGDRERLRRSLAWRGLDLDALIPALAGARLAPGAELPSWVDRFVALVTGALAKVEAYRSGARRERPRFIRPDAPFAYEMVLAPLVMAAAERLKSDTADVASPAALTALERGLLKRLSRLSGPVLAAEWARFEPETMFAEDPGRRSQRFAASMLSGPVPKFLAEYPVLARLVTLACDNWREAAEELLRRLGQDREALAATFNRGDALGALADVEVGDADVHDGHREVLILGFASGLKLVYKPRSLALDAAFRALVEHLNGRGLSLPLRAPRVLCRAGYGYAEFIERRLCADDAMLARFYRRMGALAALATALGSSDLHFNNIIACGDEPVPIDLETMLSAELRPDATFARRSAAEREEVVHTRRWALSTMILPSWQKLRGGIFADRSALGISLEGGAEAPAATSLPCPPAALEAALGAHAGAVRAGFEEMYRLLLKECAALLAPGGPLAAFDAAPLRVVLRETWLYMAILRHSIDPQVLRDGADRAIALERLNHIAAVADEPPVFLPVIAPERAALLGLDVPRFSYIASSRDLRDGNGVVAATVAVRSAAQEMRERFQGLSEDELKRQSELVHGTLLARLAQPPAGTAREPMPDATVLPSSAELVARAVEIAERVFGTARIGPDGTRSWQTLAYRGEMGRWSWTPATDGLAQGRLGLAVLFAALYYVGGADLWRERALAVARPAFARFCDLLATPPRPHIAWLGLEDGVGGALVAAAALHRLLGADAIPTDFIAAAATLAPPPESHLDVAGGVAGTLIGLLALARETGVRDLDDAALRCAAFLADADWTALAQEPWLQGRSGVALALTRWRGSSAESVATASPAPGLEGIAAAALAGSAEALEALNAAGLPTLDTLRFGTAGEVDALLFLAESRSRTELCRAAERLAAASLVRAASRGWRLLPEIDEEATALGLFDGIAGIAYMLLRLAAPSTVPSLAALALAAEAPSDSLAEHLAAALAPYRPETLISRAALAEIKSRTAAHLPAGMTGLYGFECRLGETAPEADFLVCSGPAAEQWAALQRLAAGMTAPAWQRLAGFLESGAPAAAEIHNMWLEFDLVAGPGAGVDALPPPSLFFGTDRLSAMASGEADDLPPQAEWLAATIETLRGSAPSPAQRRAIARCLAALPAAGRLFQIGLMLSRPEPFLRLCARDLGVEEIEPYLATIGWPGAPAPLAALLRRLAPLVDHFRLDLDLADRVLPPVGLECYVTEPARMAERFPALVQALTEDCLCLPEKAPGLMAWFGITHERRHATVWPPALLQKKAALGLDEASIFRRWVHHIKITLPAEGSPHAKAYLAVAPGFIADAALKAMLQQQAAAS